MARSSGTWICQRPGIQGGILWFRVWGAGILVKEGQQVPIEPSAGESLIFSRKFRGRS